LEDIQDLSPDEVMVLVKFLDLLSDPQKIPDEIQKLVSPARAMQSLLWVLEVK